jgi:hypothetical protein
MATKVAVRLTDQQYRQLEGLCRAKQLPGDLVQELVGRELARLWLERKPEEFQAPFQEGAIFDEYNNRLNPDGSIYGLDAHFEGRRQ